MAYIVSFIDRITDYMIILVGILILLVGFYGMYDSYMIFQAASDESLKKVKASYGEEDEKKGKLLDSNVAWLTIDGTNVDYPIMQGKDNAEFLNKDPYGKYTLSGSIFLDFRCSPDFSDEYSVVYGHHMAGGYLFGALDPYHKKGYLEKHSTGTLTLKDKTKYDLSLFAVLATDASDRMVFEMEYTDRANMEEYIKNAAESYCKEADKDGKILALSTCRYPDTTERTVVMARILE